LCFFELKKRADNQVGINQLYKDLLKLRGKIDSEEQNGYYLKARKLAKKIAKISGADFSALIKWEGRNRKGLIVPDGEYTGCITVWGNNFKLKSPSKSFIVDRSPPLVEMTASTTVLDQGVFGQEFITFFPEIIDESPIDRWQFQILDITGRTVYVDWSTGPVQNIVWDGKDSATDVLAPQGFYRCALQGWDMAGNESVPFFVDVYVNVTAREMLAQVLEHVTVVETDLGLLVQLKQNELFKTIRTEVELSPDSDALLHEVAILINAYPSVSVILDGYSKRFNNPGQDRHRSSLYAWKVYSYLVKQGNVKASRLSVKGRGRHPTFSRRAVDLPVVRNGVEVLLEGSGGW